MSKRDLRKAHTGTLTGRIQILILAIPEPPHVTPGTQPVILNVIQGLPHFLVCQRNTLQLFMHAIMLRIKRGMLN